MWYPGKILEAQQQTCSVSVRLICSEARLCHRNNYTKACVTQKMITHDHSQSLKKLNFLQVY